MGASSLEDKLQDTISLGNEKQRFHSHILSLLEDFEKVTLKNRSEFVDRSLDADKTWRIRIGGECTRAMIAIAMIDELVRRHIGGVAVVNHQLIKHHHPKSVNFAYQSLIAI